MDDDKLPTTHLEPPPEVDIPSDNIDNDVIIINRTVPEVVISSDSSGNSSSFFGNVSSVEKDLDVSSSADSLLQLPAEAKSDEESCLSFVILDDDDGHSPNKEIKKEQLGDCLDIKEIPVGGYFSVKSETKFEIKAAGDTTLKLEKLITKVEIPATVNTDLLEMKDFKIKNDSALCKSENLENSTLSSDSNSVANSCHSSSTVSHTSALRPSLSSNETFVLQLNTTDALDKTSSDPSCNSDSKDNEDCLKNSMEETDSAQSSVAMIPAKVPEQDSLILTADEELETEMSLAVKVKNDKNQESLEEKKHDETHSSKSDIDDQEVLKTINNAPSNIEPISKTDTALDVNTKRDVTANTNDNPDPTENDQLVSLPSDKVTNKSDLKKVAISATNAKKPDASRILWVSNVTHSVKATDLKHYISKAGKVVTAKVVTDGKKCYGYVVMENQDDANACVKTLNNAYFEGKKISLSFTKPTKSSSVDKNPEMPTSENDKPKPQKEDAVRVKSCNATDDVKISKSNKDSQSSKHASEKRRRSPSKSRSARSTKRRQSDDPLTTRFRSRTRERREYRRKSRSTDRYDYKGNLREKLERDRLKRKLMEEQRKNRDEMMRRMQREEKQRELEFKLEQERKKLQLERELFERERRELLRLDAERRKIEKERMEVFHQRTKLEQDYQTSRMKRKADEFNLSSTIVKPQEAVKAYDKRKDISKPMNNDANYRKFSNSKHEFQKSSSNIIDDRKTISDAKNRIPSNHRNVPKSDRGDFKSGRDNRGGSKMAKRDDFKSYDRPVPPPPKLNNDFDDSIGRKIKHSDHKHDYSEGKPHGDRKPERGGRKIEVIDRKYYADRPNDDADRKHVYRKPEFDERKVHSFPDRKYEFGREMKRYREDGYPDRDNSQRTPWPGPVNYNDPWKPTLPSTVTTTNPVRYQDGNFSSAPYGGPRIPPFYYHPTPPAQEYPRYDHCAQVTGRKY